MAAAAAGPPAAGGADGASDKASQRAGGPRYMPPKPNPERVGLPATRETIALDEMDEEELRNLAPAPKRPKRPKEKSAAELEEEEQLARMKAEYEERIRNRLARLRDRSLSPERQKATEQAGEGLEEESERALQRKKDREERERLRQQRELERLQRGELGQEAARRLKKEGRPMTKIELQLEKARLHREKARREMARDGASGLSLGGKRALKRGSSRLREFEMMAPTDYHWSDKAVDKMTERDWRIFREDFEMEIRGGGASCPQPLRNWEEAYRMNVVDNDRLMETIHEAGYKDPSPIQMACIPIGKRRLDMVGIAETGSGKTAAYIIPLVLYILEQPALTAESREDGPLALVMCPTRELARQIEEEGLRFCEPHGFKTVSVVGGTTHEDQHAEIRRGVHLLIGTPGRLCDLLERHYLALNQCNYVVLDEADEMVTDGMEQQIVSVFNHMPASNSKPAELDEEELGRTYRVTMMFSATFSPELERVAQRHLRRPVTVKIGVGSPSDIKQVIECWVPASEKKERLLQTVRNALSSQGTPRIIVFFNHRPTVDWALEFLLAENFHAATIHGGMTQDARERTLAGFHEDRYNVLLGTDVLARGIDVKGCTHVINYDCPSGDKAIDKYTHRIGRTGRAGHKGTAITFMTKDDTDIMYHLVKKLELCQQAVPHELRAQDAAKVPPGEIVKKKKSEEVIYKA
eukprot:TRINITY_DN13068_c0_g1_i1.p1 TRINITY_DN13068_c0_g1~~TRINITY_DN13068_c0_g1_i1.p1  ORF type:complete len:696 (+),score=271.63 TRINITY_DN13068_c0_g1_i1:80-2167(+)